MSNHAANPAATPFVSLKSAWRRSASFLRRNDDAELPSLCGVADSSNEPAILANFVSQIADDGIGPERASRFVSRLLFGHGFGAYPAPRGSASFCFGYAALRVMVPP